MADFLLLVIVLVVSLGWFGVRYMEWKHIFEPQLVVKATPSDVGLDFEEIRFISEDSNPLHGWWIPHPEAMGTVLYCHGSGGNLGDRVALLEGLHRLGVHVFAFDYRGYGQSRGIPTEEATYRDARAAFEVVRSRYADTESPPVVAYGRSLGGAVAVQLAHDKPVRGLIIEGTFTSIRDMARLQIPSLPFYRFCTFRYDVLKQIRTLQIPKLIAHSADDERIPYAQGKALFEAAAEPKQFVELRGAHCEPAWHGTSGYMDTLRTFLAEVLTGGPQDQPGPQ